VAAGFSQKARNPRLWSLRRFIQIAADSRHFGRRERRMAPFVRGELRKIRLIGYFGAKKMR
jgi:hypothetical protein